MDCESRGNALNNSKLYDACTTTEYFELLLSVHISLERFDLATHSCVQMCLFFIDVFSQLQGVSLLITSNLFLMVFKNFNTVIITNGQSWAFI